MNKLLKTDRSGHLNQGAKNVRRPSNKFRFRIQAHPCADPDYATVRVFLTFAGRRSGVVSTGIKAKRDTVDVRQNRVIGDEQANATLIDLEARANRLFADCRLTGRVVDVNTIKTALFSDSHLIAPVPDVKQFIDQWLANDNARWKAGEIAERTLWKNKRWTNDFWAFVVHKFGDKAYLSALKPGDIKEFVRWLRTIRELSNNVAQATASHARTLMNYALDQELISKNPFINFRRKMDPIERETLTEEEISTFCTHPLQASPLCTVRDIFLFMCLTGLSYTDVQKLTASSIRKEGGRLYLRVYRQKMLSRSNTVPATIPLSDVAIAILTKYAPQGDDERLLPIQANAPFNRALKQIAFLCNLDKSVSTKVARNSLATYLLNQGVPLVSVSAILGHSSTLTTQHSYAKTSPKRVIDDVSHLHERLNGNGLYGIQFSSINQ